MRGSWILLAALIVTMGAACFEQKCGPKQKLKDEVCVCDDGYAFDEKLVCVEIQAQATGDGGTASGGDAGAASPGGCDPGTGLGCSCKSDADCAAYPADYCILPDPADAEMKRACMLQGCKEAGKECPTAMHCCDFPFAPKGTVCLPEEFECPFG